MSLTFPFKWEQMPLFAYHQGKCFSNVAGICRHYIYIHIYSNNNTNKTDLIVLKTTGSSPLIDFKYIFKRSILKTSFTQFAIFFFLYKAKKVTIFPGEMLSDLQGYREDSPSKLSNSSW